MKFFDQLGPDMSKKKSNIITESLCSSHLGLLGKYAFQLLMSSIRNTTCSITQSADQTYWKSNQKHQQKDVIKIKSRPWYLFRTQRGKCDLKSSRNNSVSPITTRNRDEQAQRGRWLFKITCVGGPCAGCPRICLSPLAILCSECRRRQNFPNFPSRNRQTREDFLLPLTLRREGSGEQLFTCCQDFLLPWVRQLDFELKKTKRQVFTQIPLRMKKLYFLLSFWTYKLLHVWTCDSIPQSFSELPFVGAMSARTPPVSAACCTQKHNSRKVQGLD